MKLWGGRFRKETDSLVNDFNASIHFDARLYQEDIQGSMAHARMLSDCGIISPEDNRQIYAAKYLPYLPTEAELKRELNLEDFEKLED